MRRTSGEQPSAAKLSRKTPRALGFRRGRIQPISKRSLDRSKTIKDFFVSYNKADGRWAEWIAWKLEAAGYSVIIRAWDFRPGTNFVLEMQNAANIARCTIAVLSSDYLESSFTASEWAAAFAQDPKCEEGKLIPIRIAPCEMSGILATINYLDLVGLSKRAAEMALLGAFRRSKPATAPKFPQSTNSDVCRVKSSKSDNLVSKCSPPELVKAWKTEIIGLQNDNGAFRISSDPTDVTQVWTSAQCLVGLLSSRGLVFPYTDSILRCFNFLEAARTDSKQGGWGMWERSEFPIVEITGWVSLAYSLSMSEDVANVIWSRNEQSKMVTRIRRDLDCNLKLQYASGGWVPIEGVFQNEIRTYSTIMALWSELAAFVTPRVKRFVGDRYKRSIVCALHWLKNSFRSDLSTWVAKPSRLHQHRRLPGLSAQIIYVLSLAERQPDFSFVKHWDIFKNAKHLFLNRLTVTPVGTAPTPEDQMEMQDQAMPPAVQLEGSTFLTFPWILRACQILKTDATLSVGDRSRAADQEEHLRHFLPEFSNRLLNGVTQTFEIAESLAAIISAEP